MPGIFGNTFDLLLETILYKYADPVKFSCQPDSNRRPGHLSTNIAGGLRVMNKSIQDLQGTQSASVPATQWTSNPLNEQVDKAEPVQFVLDVHQPGSFGAGPQLAAADRYPVVDSMLNINIDV